MKLVVISSPVPLVNEAQLINDLFACGLKHFHLRKPGSSYSSTISLMKKIKPEYYPRIALHQFHETAMDFGIKRLHFTEEQRKKTDDYSLKHYRKEGYKLSSSVHDLNDLQKLTGFDYLFFSPVFDSISKSAHLGVIGRDFRLPTTKKSPVIALGGVTATHLDRIKTMNFDGAAVLGAIWSQPEKAIESFNHLMNNLPDKNEYR